jgi:hypothetical protein
MRTFLPMIAASLLIGGAAQARPSDPEAELARALEGRVAGTPVHCIDLHRVQSSQVINRTAILYRVGGIIYVNRPDNGAEQLNRNDTMVNRLYGTARLCNVDTVTMVEPASGSFTGVVFLGDFVPYRRAESADAR